MSVYDEVMQRFDDYKAEAMAKGVWSDEDPDAIIIAYLRVQLPRIREEGQMNKVNLLRELQKARDNVHVANLHFKAEAEMNAALHMAATTRPAPLAMAIAQTDDDLGRLIAELVDEEEPSA